MYRLIAVDLDGTLLSSNNKITKYTEKIIKSLINKNFYFVFASGRHYIDLMNIKSNLKIKIFIISSNGSRVYDVDDKLIFENNLDADISLNLCKIVYDDPDIITQVYCDDKWYVNNVKIKNNFCPSLSVLKYKHFDLNMILSNNNISKVFFTSHNIAKLHDLHRKIIMLFHRRVTANFSVPGCLEVISGNTSKGYGLKLIVNILGISLEQCISFGDGMNDYDMLSISGKACIMKNADPNLKKAIPYAEIIGSNDNDGVANFLRKKFL